MIDNLNFRKRFLDAFNAHLRQEMSDEDLIEFTKDQAIAMHLDKQREDD